MQLYYRTNNMAEFKNFDSSVLEGNVKFREKKTWKRRWCVIRRLSPVANSLIMQLYKRPSGKGKGMQTKASLNLEHLLGIESCFLLQKESLTLAIICKSLTAILAFETREMLLEWQAQITEILGLNERYEVQLLSVPGKLELSSSSAVLHIRDWQFSLSQGIPPRLIGYWNMADLRRFGAVDDRRFCFEGGSRCSARGLEGLFVLGSTRSQEIGSKFEYAIRGRLSDSQRSKQNPSTNLSGFLTPMTRHRLSVNSRCLSQSMSKPNTPLLGSQRRAQEFCLSPPCARHTRSASQQHSRASSISSGTRRSSTLQQSDPELLYDKPRSLNATMTQAVYEVCGNSNDSRPPSALPTSHYDTPRRVLQSLDAIKHTDNICTWNTRPEGNSLEVPRAINTLYATVTKPKKNRKQLDMNGTSNSTAEGQPYVFVSHGPGHPNCCSRMTNCISPPCMAQMEHCSRPCCSHVIECDNRCWSEQQYQNSLWLRLQAEGAAATYQNPMNLRCVYPRTCNPHGTLPLIHSRSSSTANDNVPLRLRRSASMPAAACRQGNRDSSDSTDSGVSVTADSVNHQHSVGLSSFASNSSCSHHHYLHHHVLQARHWSLLRSQITGHSMHQISDFLGNSGVAKNLSSMPVTNVTTDTVTTGDTGCHSHSSSISNILDNLETLSVASVGYETSV